MVLVYVVVYVVFFQAFVGFCRGFSWDFVQMFQGGISVDFCYWLNLVKMMKSILIHQSFVWGC